MADQVEEFNAAFAQAGVKKPKVIDWDAPLPQYPSPRYVEKNLAPEKTLTYGDVRDLAEARRDAEAAGVISPELGEHMLPMAMVEGRPGNFGINDGNGFLATPASIERAKKLGLGITDLTDPAVAERHRYDFHEDDMASGKRNYYRRITIQGPNGPQEAHEVAEGPPTTPFTIDYIQPKPKFQTVGAGTNTARVMHAGYESAPPRIPGNKMLNVQGSGEQGAMARIMAFMLAEKHAVNPAGDAEGTVKLYNGRGKMTDQYLAKVRAARDMTRHERNAPLMAHFNEIYRRKK